MCRAEIARCPFIAYILVGRFIPSLCIPITHSNFATARSLKLSLIPSSNVCNYLLVWGLYQAMITQFTLTLRSVNAYLQGIGWMPQHCVGGECQARNYSVINSSSQRTYLLKQHLYSVVQRCSQVCIYDINYSLCPLTVNIRILY